MEHGWFRGQMGTGWEGVLRSRVGGSGPRHPGSTWKVTEEKGEFPDVRVIPGCWGDWFCDTGKKVGTSCQWCEHQTAPLH